MIIFQAMSEDHDETPHTGLHHVIFHLGLTVCVYIDHSWECVGLLKVLMFGNLCTCIILL